MRLRTSIWVLALAIATLTPVSSSQALPASSISKNVTLVVDFGKQSGRPTRVLTVNDVAPTLTGWNLLSLAKLKVQGTQQYPLGFVCRIDGWPTAKQQDCSSTPSFRSGHWAYYVTNFQLGGGWLLSGQGAGSHIPDCGGYEGWSWISGGQPNTPPRFKVAIRACK
jgi:hypothetical protein